MTFPLNEMYGYSRLCDRLRSSAIIWKQVSLRSSAIYDPRSSAIRDRLRSFAIIWKPAFTITVVNALIPHNYVQCQPCLKQRSVEIAELWFPYDRRIANDRR